ncbi:predicted protein [Nematostella vectensis]|uniref:Acyltransferase n=1 Tax=Nematostella vectensis TaxID=45351 RepID=A7S4U4_NEMVE|nr:predicted protein [Nematostella vectensis]|eukprot:XP_001633322.1 predicted protein [Nematostella vectensis]
MASIEWAPVKLPFKRRLETLTVILIVHSFLFGHILGCGLMVLLLILPATSLVAAIYLGWTYVVNYNKPSRGGRIIPWCRRLKMWKYFCEFFPISLIKTADLDPQKNYIICYHPHGIMSLGALGNFCSEATGFSEKFPGITPHILTLAGNMKFPVTRDYMMAFGVCTVEKESIHHIMERMGKGHAAVIVTGGAAESLDAHPGSFKITLKERKGFVKIAMKTGASLVPVFSFGENELYSQVDNPRGSSIRQWQTKMKNLMGFAPPLFYGRGIFQYTYGILPHRRPINTVVGAPITVERNPQPSWEQVCELHKQYVTALCELFDKHKIKYGIEKDVHLEIC